MSNNWDQYSEYLQLNKILGAQKLSSEKSATGATHDEMLFIQFHQIYELWFKQILFELDDVQNRFSSDIVDDHDMQPIVAYLNRIVEILKHLVSMIDVLETMPSQSFIDFREHLGTASGFQSWQFRIIETKLGLRRKDRLQVFHADFDALLKDSHQKSIYDAEQDESLFDQLDRWLSRTPFIQKGNYEFWTSYTDAVYNMMDEKAAEAKKSLSGETLDKELKAIEKGKLKFEGIFNPEKHKQAQEDDIWRFSWKALQSALFITLYRDKPVLQAPHRLLTCIMDIDELLARWRHRHALMAQRMMGASIGTGGSSGYGYLLSTVEKHRIYSDLFALSTYLIPSDSLPSLPEEVSNEMGYRYGSTGSV
jgi:tryptophan 2,3-dioxygenase